MITRIQKAFIHVLTPANYTNMQIYIKKATGSCAPSVLIELHENSVKQKCKHSHRFIDGRSCGEKEPREETQTVTRHVGELICLDLMSLLIVRLVSYTFGKHTVAVPNWLLIKLT